ncbi:MAG: hypothetical protein ACI87E_001488 [Mariniblastus sp.]|jgi:hypothetical protein
MRVALAKRDMPAPSWARAIKSLFQKFVLGLLLQATNWRRPAFLPFLECAAPRDRFDEARLEPGWLLLFSSARHNAILWKNPHIPFMKQELPFAVALLAAGCLLWFSQSTESSKSSGDQTGASTGSSQVAGDLAQPPQNVDSANSGRQRVKDLAADSSFNARASYQDAVASENSDSTMLTTDETAVSAEAAKQPNAKSPANRFVFSVSNQQSITFLAATAKQVADSQPLTSTLQMTGNMYGEVVSATGSYYQMGQGTSKSRIDLSFGMLPNSPRVFQLCDGRFVYKLQTEGADRKFEFVDLLRVSEKAGERSGGISPTGWVASGGIASLFQHLASAFNFGPPEFGNDSTVTLRGSWDENVLRRILGSGSIAFEPRDSPFNASDWSQVPAQLPHAVELIFERHPQFGYFPKQISFLKFELPGRKRIPRNKKVKSSPDGAGLPGPIPTVTLAFSATQSLTVDSNSPTGITDRFFVIDSSNLESVDLTDEYIARIRRFEQSQQATTAGSTIDR